MKTCVNNEFVVGFEGINGVEKGGEMDHKKSFLTAKEFDLIPLVELTGTVHHTKLLTAITLSLSQ